MLTTSVKAICFNYRPKKDNTYPIMLRLTKSGKRKYVSLGVSVKEENWDFNKNIPKRNCPDRDLILSFIEKRTAEYRAQINEYMVENKDYTLETLVQRVESSVRNMTVGTSSPILVSQKGTIFTIQRINVMLKEIKRRYHLRVGNFSCHSLRKTFGRQVYTMSGDSAEFALVK